MNQEAIQVTYKQLKVLAAIEQYIYNTGFPPTHKELADILGFKSQNAAKEHLETLYKKGLIKLTRKVSRGIQILNKSISVR